MNEKYSSTISSRGKDGAETSHISERYGVRMASTDKVSSTGRRPTLSERAPPIGRSTISSRGKDGAETSHISERYGVRMASTDKVSSTGRRPTLSERAPPIG